MGETILQRSIRERQRAFRRAQGADIRRIRLEAGLSLRDLGAAIGIDASHLSRVEAGERDVSQATLVAIAAAAGHDASLRFFPSSGPRVRDHIQVRMLEAVASELHPRWRPLYEVPVYRPVHGIIDIVLRDRLTSDIVAGEGHSVLSTVDGQVRWAHQKADALPSATGFPWAPLIEPARVSRLLVLRSSRAMIDLVAAVAHTFASAYPAPYEEAIASLTDGVTRWPGDALLWVAVDGSRTRLLRTLPRS